MELKNKREGEIWKDGYEMGVKIIMRENDLALKIGQAILDALDKRYKFADEVD